MRSEMEGAHGLKGFRLLRHMLCVFTGWWSDFLQLLTTILLPLTKSPWACLQGRGQFMPGTSMHAGESWKTPRLLVSCCGLPITQPNHCGRNAAASAVICCGCKMVFAFCCSFCESVCSSRLWNGLSTELKPCTSIHEFIIIYKETCSRYRDKGMQSVFELQIYGCNNVFWLCN